MKREDVENFASEHEIELLLADGLDDALIGVAQQFSHYVAVYDTSKVIEILMERDGMTFTEALEHFDFNIVGAHVGESTPVFMVPQEEIEK